MLHIESQSHHPWQLVLQFVISLYIVRVIRKAVRAMAVASGATSLESEEIELAVGEALANVYHHAYGHDGGQATVRMSSEQGAVEILVENEGSGIYPDVTIPAVAPTAGRGRGLYLMNRLMDTVEILRPLGTGPGTAVRMTKRLANGHAA